MTLTTSSQATAWKVPMLTAVGKDGKVVKDQYGLLVLDQRDSRIVGYRQRWYTDNFQHAHSRSFKRNQLDEAQRFRVRLLDAHDHHLAADAHGLPIEARESSARPSAVAQSRTLFEEFEWALNAHAAKLSTNTRTGYRTTLEFVRLAAESEEVFGLHADMRPAELTPAICQDLLLYRRETNLRTPGEQVSQNTERLFSAYLSKLLRILTSRGLFAANPWDGARELLRCAPEVVLSEKNVASQERVLDLAAAVAGIPGGERFACVVRTAGRQGLRPGEMRAIAEHNFRDRLGDAPYLRLEESRPIVSARDDSTGSRIPIAPLKHRAPGAHRDVPLFAGVLSDVEAHLDAFCCDAQPFFSTPNGRTPDASSWLKRYWHPAVQSVFGTSESSLRQMSFRHLRHSAITWWLAAGVSVQQAADWAGNSPQVLLKHYAGFIDGRSIPANPNVRRELFGVEPTATSVGCDS